MLHRQYKRSQNDIPNSFEGDGYISTIRPQDMGMLELWPVADSWLYGDRIRVAGFSAIFNMTVLSRHGNRRVAECLLNNFHIPGCLVQQRAAGMPQRMTTAS